jgi:serine/threonine protein kinase
MLIDAYGNVKVSDFGMGRIVERDQSVIRQVYVGTGSVAYMAPELFTDPAGSDAQTDIYALGIIFYELLTRKLPGRRSAMPSEIDKTIPKGIDDIFDLMTRDDRSERYSTVDDILDDFDKIPSLETVIGAQATALESKNPLQGVTFKESSGSSGLAGGNSAPAASSDDVVSSASDDDEEGGKRRPYSYQQRNKK